MPKRARVTTEARTAGKGSLVDGSKATGPAPRPVSRVVIPVGGDDEEYLAQEQAVLFAAALDVPVRALHVTDDLESVSEALFGFLRQQGERWGVQLDTVVVPGADVPAVLLAEIDALDLVVIGTRRLGSRFHLGSIAERLVNESPGPVQVVRLRGLEA